MALGDSIDHGESDAGALARRLRREKRLEYAVADRPINPASFIRDRKPDKAARCVSESLALKIDSKRAAVWHRVPRVDHQIECDLFDLRLISTNGEFWFTWVKEKMNVLGQ